MAKNVESPADVQIAAMQREERRFGNLLEPGSGTPWEDRGSIGFIPAFFKTAFMSMILPGKLLFALRRPETASDARIFAILCAIFLGLGWVVQDYVDFLWRDKRLAFDYISDGYLWAFHFVLAAGGALVLLKLITRIFYKLISAGDMRSKFPPVLTSNIYSYCMGPSILALIPFRIGPFQIGMSIAVIWIFCLFVYAAINRLAIKPSGAIICNAITYWGLLGLMVGGYQLIYFIYDKFL